MGHLSKQYDRQVIAPYQPARPGRAAIDFWLYATPPPQGYAYRPLGSAANFAHWSQLVQAPLQYGSVVGGYRFVPLALIDTTEPLPSGTRAVHGLVGGEQVLIGYDVPIMVTTPLPPAWYSPVARMTYVKFEGPTSPNGYPLSAGPFDGYFDVPTSIGQQRVQRRYVKDGRGVLIPDGNYPLPPLCVLGGSCQVTMLANFPGSQPAPAIAARYLNVATSGWDAGANSIAVIDGDVLARVRVAVAAAGVVGLCASRPNVGEPDSVSHGFYLDIGPEGRARCRVFESGRLVGAARSYAPGVTELAVRRVSSIVTYEVDGVATHESAIPSYGPVQLGTALYRSGDAITQAAFEHIEGGETETPIPDAAGYGGLRMTGSAHEQSIAQLGAVGRGMFRLLQTSAAGQEPEPPEVTVGFGTFEIVAGYCYSATPEAPAEGAGGLQLSGYAYEASEFGRGQIGIVGLGVVGDTFVPPDPIDDAIFVGEAIRGRQSSRADTTMRVMQQLRVRESAPTRMSGTVLTREELDLAERVSMVQVLLIEEGVLINEQLTSDFRALERVIERLLLQGEAHTHAEAVSVVVTGLAFNTLMQDLDLLTATEGMEFNAALLDQFTAQQRAVEAILLAGAAQAQQHLTVLVRESMVLHAGPETQADFLTAVREGMGWSATLSLDTGEYIAWVLNAESKGLSRYTNYPFNSMARVGGVYMGAAADGLHVLDGDDDNGEPIQLRIRAGLSDFGTRRLKRIPEAFFAITSDGQFLVQLVFIDERTSERHGAIYRVRPHASADLTPVRRKFGRGMDSVHWDFVIENVDGAQLELESIEFRPLMLDRRTRGN